MHARLHEASYRGMSLCLGLRNPSVALTNEKHHNSNRDQRRVRRVTRRSFVIPQSERIEQTLKMPNGYLPIRQCVIVLPFSQLDNQLLRTKINVVEVAKGCGYSSESATASCILFL